MTYDENVNLLTMNDSCGTTTYTWDVRNRLVGITGYKPDCFPLSASFEYDAIGRRIEKTINGVTTQYLYDGMDIVQEIQGGVVTANYIRTLNVDEPLARIQADGTVRYYQTDGLGSAIALADENGNVMTTYTYDPFGNVTISGEASDNPFQYTGRENDGTGLYYYRARYYSAELQRFISEDPIGIFGGINSYSYTANSPINLTDPSGLLSVGDATGGAIEGIRHGWESGYYKCYMRCMAGPLGSILAAHIGGYFYSQDMGNLAARTYYHFTDRRFTAWGKYSKSLVPELAPKVAEYIEGGLAAWLAFDAWHCIAECRNCLE
ncbi:MAG: RHS repeat-associated core domain-containing protein [Candidatus Sulfobium sp.]